MAMRFRRIKEEQVLSFFLGRILAYSAPDSLVSLEMHDAKSSTPVSFVCIPSRIPQEALATQGFVLVYAVQPAKTHKMGEVLAIYPTALGAKDFAKIRLDFAKICTD